MARLLNQDPEMIKRMECDLIASVKLAYGNVPDLEVNVHGVFSLDHLDQMLESDLCNGVGVGVGYLECAALPNQSPNVDRGMSALMTAFRFVIVLAVPTEESCGTRHNATTLLSLLRLGIQGTTISGDHVNRTWQFIAEKPEISASGKSMLYYSQVWQVALPSVGNKP